jgi:hypothetical protein
LNEPFDSIHGPRVVEIFSDRPNYRVAYSGAHSAKACIYFSSNGIYFPNTAAEFERRIGVEDRFEWTKNLLNAVDKHIFVRDVRKQWYVGGISAELDDVPKVAALLRRETEGMRVTTLGISAGGYAAVLFGCLIGARTTIAINAQFELEYMLRDPARYEGNRLVMRGGDTGARQWYDLRPLILEHSGAIYYITSTRSGEDVSQAARVADCAAVRTISVDSDVHGVPFYTQNLTTLLNMTDHQLEALPRGRSMNPVEFSARIEGFRRTSLLTARNLSGRVWGRAVKLAKVGRS